MKRVSILFLLFFTLSIGPLLAETTEGKVTGGTVYSIPQWFKSSFLDFSEDIAEAKVDGKHVMVFMHLDECPYCVRMLEENFIRGDAKEFMQQHFDVIAVNVRGDLEVTWIDGVTYTEMELSKHLKTMATPTIIFLEPGGNKVMQLNGYRDSQSFRYALHYVQSEQYRQQGFADYLASQKRPEVYAFRAHPQFETATYFKGFNEPLAILFEDRYCEQCDDFHINTLNRPAVLAAMEGFLVVRLDVDSDKFVIDLDGQKIKPAQWLKALGLSYRPGIVLFNQGREMFRADGLLYHQHLTEALRYVGDGYLHYGSIREFKDAFRLNLLKNGLDVDYGER